MHHTIAIVILNFNGAHFLEKFLPTVIRHSSGFRIIVADNCSTDNSVPLLRKQFPEVEILELPENFGFAGGYNQALKEISATYYILLNSDVEVSADWITPMVKLLEANPEVAACQPKIRSWHNRAFFEYAGASGGQLDLLAYPFCRGRIFDTLEEDKGQHDQAVPVFWATGACMMVRASVYHGLGGFDARFFAHMEEIDLCWRMHKAGYLVYVCPASTVFHVGGGTLPKNNPHKTFLNFRNGLWMLYKNSSSKDLLWKIPARLALDMAAALLFILKHQKEDAKAVLKAHKSFLASLPEFAQERRMLKKNKYKKAPLYKGFIVWDYYVRKTRKYNKLKR